MELKNVMKNRLLELSTTLYGLLDEQTVVLGKYEYVDVDIIEQTWDKQIKIMAKYNGISEETYEILYNYYLDGRVAINGTVIEDFNELIEYIVDKAYENIKD